MAVAFILDFAGGSAGQYDAVVEDMGLGGRMPAGGVFHAAGATEGGWRVCDVWETPEAFEELARAKIRPMAARHGLPEPQIRSFEVHQLRRGGGGTPTFLQIVRIAGMDVQAFEEMDRAILGSAREVPADCIFHVNGRLGDGWCVLDAWTSREARDAFIDAHIRPAMEAAGVTSRPDFEEMAVRNTLAPAQQTVPA